MDTSLRSVHDALNALQHELTSTRAIAQLLLRRLDREPDDQSGKKEACQVIIEQTRLIEQALDRINAESSRSHGPGGQALGQVAAAPAPARAGLLAADRGRGPAAGVGHCPSCAVGSGRGPRMELTAWHATVDTQMDAHGFTPTERRVAWELLKARSNKEIAQTLGVAENTVKSHVTAIFGKTCSSCRVGLVVTLLGLIDEPVA